MSTKITALLSVTPRSLVDKILYILIPEDYNVYYIHTSRTGKRTIGSPRTVPMNKIFEHITVTSKYGKVKLSL
jgi:hypothetical protein